MTERQKICKCGNAVGDLLVRTSQLEELLKGVKIEKAPLHVSGFKESINYIYGGIRNIEDFCNVDAREEQQYSMEAFNRISEMEVTKDSNTFYENRNNTLRGLDKIKRGIMEKIRDCSK